MTNIDNWNEFKLSELFQISGTVTTPKSRIKFVENGKYPYITTATTNGGIAGYSDECTEKGGVSTVDSAVIGTVFFQKDNFLASDHVEKLIPLFHMDDKIALFMVTVLNKSRKTYGYSYANKRSQSALKRETIMLPTTKDSEIDFKYMSDYVDSVLLKSKGKIDKLTFLTENHTHQDIDTKNWQRFHLYDENLFEIDSGNKLDYSKMSFDTPIIDFVGRSNFKNGVKGKVKRIEGLVPYRKGNLTLSLGGKYLGSCFIQENNFYTSQNVNVLIPKWNMTDEMKMFIATVIFKESQLYYESFINELNRHVKTDFSIPLPVNKTGEIDFQYMHTYIESVSKKASIIMERLK